MAFLPSIGDPTNGTWLSLGSYEEVFNSDFDYWSIHRDLKNCNMNLVRILRIHNSDLKERFDAELNLIQKNKGQGFNPNIQDLYHGTSETLDRICHEGLDERLSTTGHFGRGIYFSNNPGMCRIQSEATSSTSRFIVRCKVILGDSKVYGSGDYDTLLTREPKKSSVDGKNIFYDSVEGTTGDFKQFVIYEKRRARVEYVIYYTTETSLPSLPPVPSVSKLSKKKGRSCSRERRSSTSSQGDTGRHSRSSSQDGNLSGSERSGSPESREGSPSGQSTKDAERRVASEPETENRRLTTRDRTRRLLNQSVSNTSGEATSPIATTQGARGGAEGASGVADVANASLGVDHLTVEYKRGVQEAAMRQLLDLKGSLSPHEMQDLYECYNKTYGGMAFPTENEVFQTSDSNDVNVQAVLDVLTEQFQQVVGFIDPDLARDCIMQSDMDLDKAISAYFDMQN